MSDIKKRRTLIVIILTLLTMAVEISVGFLSGSMALLADGWHMGSHALSLGITYFAYVLIDFFDAKKDISINKEKVNTLAGYTSALFLGAAGVLVVVESCSRLLNPVAISFNEAITIAVIGLLINGICLFVMGVHNTDNFHTHGSHKSSGVNLKNDYNYRSAYMHILADVFTSILAIVSIISAKYFNLLIIDILVGIMGGVIIIKWSMGILKDTLIILVDLKKEGKTKNMARDDCLVTK